MLAVERHRRLPGLDGSMRGSSMISIVALSGHSTHDLMDRAELADVLDELLLVGSGSRDHEAADA
jgi:lactate dehydrogenase-like 2-hydroxyacid dehydrogenase